MPCGCVTPPQIKRQPTNSNPLGGMGTASLGDAATTSQWGPAFKPARRPAPAAQGVDPRGIWTGWTRQKSAGAAPDRAGRMTDHAGQARRHACATPLGSQSPLLYFITYFLKCLAMISLSSLRLSFVSSSDVFVFSWSSINTSSSSFILSSLCRVPAVKHPVGHRHHASVLLVGLSMRFRAVWPCLSCPRGVSGLPCWPPMAFAWFRRWPLWPSLFHGRPLQSEAA